MCCTAWSASRPAISISPMWLTSNKPARVRTAMCSSTIPEYSTGISQPPNSTIRAPSARWRALSGVFFSGPGAGSDISSSESGEDGSSPGRGRRATTFQRYYAPPQWVKAGTRDKGQGTRDKGKGKRDKDKGSPVEQRPPIHDRDDLRIGNDLQKKALTGLVDGVRVVVGAPDLCGEQLLRHALGHAV